MGCEGIFRKLRGQGYEAATALVFLFLRDAAGCSEDLRVACAPRYVAEELDYSEKAVRTALKKLAAGGLIKIETKARGYTMVSILWGAEKGASRGAVEVALKQHVFDVLGAEKGAAKGATGVSGSLDVNRVVVVSPAVDIAIEEKGRAPMAARPSAREAKRVDDMAMQTPKLDDVTRQIEALYGAMAGYKFPWQRGKDFVRLAGLVQNYTAPVVLAACDYFFNPGNEWGIKKGFRIDEFISRFGELLLKPGIKARAARYASDNWASMGPVVEEKAQQRHSEIESITYTRAQQNKAPKETPRDMTDGELQEIHDAKVRDLKYCGARDCQRCKKAAPPVAALAGSSDVKARTPF